MIRQSIGGDNSVLIARANLGHDTQICSRDEWVAARVRIEEFQAREGEAKAIGQALQGVATL